MEHRPSAAVAAGVDAHTAGAAGGPPDIAARLADLERENADLRRRLLELSDDGRRPPASGGGPRTARHRWRSATAVVLLVLGTLLAPAGAIAAWAKGQLTDTDAYAATVAPLASDPVVQSAVSGRLTEAVMSRIDVGALLDDVVTGLDEADVAPRAVTALGALEAPLTSGVESFVRSAADRVVTSDAFVTAWERANRVAHEELVAVMEGQGGDLVQVGRDGQLTIQLAGMIELLKERLVERGLDVAANIPTVDATFVIMETTQLVEIQNRYGQLVTLTTWLPWVALGLLAAGVLVSTHRLRTLMVAGLALAAAMVALGIALGLARSLYLGALSDVVVRLDAAEVVFDQVASPLRGTLRTAGVLGLVVALAAFLAGGSASARSLRAGAGRGFASARTWGETRGWTTGAVGLWLGRHRSFARAVVIAVAALVLLLAADPTAGLVIGTAVVAGAVVALLELVSRPPARPAPSP
ncbi:hypothetical protein ABE437_03475 [Isoptericola cucumis]|uniref:hypothetical protein n=1 Tax=Isoptericola cucumis TaxID=1776856 RepID=UPI0032088EEC